MVVPVLVEVGTGKIIYSKEIKYGVEVSTYLYSRMRDRVKMCFALN